MFLGKPNAGKGTYAKILSKKFNIPHISSGEIFREMKAANPKFAAKMQPYDEKGELYPDDLAVEIVTAKLITLNGYILDGFPRTLPQARMFKALVKVIFINASDEVIQQRAAGLEQRERRSGLCQLLCAKG